MWPNLEQFPVRGTFLTGDHFRQHLRHDFNVSSHYVQLAPQPGNLVGRWKPSGITDQSKSKNSRGDLRDEEQLTCSGVAVMGPGTAGVCVATGAGGAGFGVAVAGADGARYFIMAGSISGVPCHWVKTFLTTPTFENTFNRWSKLSPILNLTLELTTFCRLMCKKKNF